MFNSTLYWILYILFSEGEEVRLKLKLSDCLEAFATEETVEQFFSTALNDKTTAKKWVYANNETQQTTLEVYDSGKFHLK